MRHYRGDLCTITGSELLTNASKLYRLHVELLIVRVNVPLIPTCKDIEYLISED